MPAHGPTDVHGYTDTYGPINTVINCTKAWTPRYANTNALYIFYMSAHTYIIYINVKSSDAL